MKDIQPCVSAALLLTMPAITEQMGWDCVAAGVKYIWMHRGSGVGAVSPSAVAFCREDGV